MPLTASAAGTSNSGQKVIYVPLDDRPFHVERMLLMAESLNISLVMPDTSLYTTKLDGQQGASSTDSRGSMFSWLKKQMAADPDAPVILSLDQLLSGGLIESRTIEENRTFLLPGSGRITEYDVINFIAGAANGREIYVIDSVMRLAGSIECGGFTVSDSRIISDYAKVERPVLSGKNLTVENIISNYPYASDGRTPASNYVSYDPAVVELLARYDRIRARKLRLVDYAMAQLCGRDNLHFLLGIDDSAQGDTVQANELSYLRQYLTEEDGIFSALDGLAQTALAHLCLDGGKRQIAVNVSFFGDYADTVQSDNRDSPRKLLEGGLRFFGAYETSGTPDVSIVVLTDTETSENWGSSLIRLVNQLNDNAAKGIPTIFVDYSSRSSITVLQEETQLSMLLSYSGGYEAPNQIMMALSQGFARYDSLKNQEQTAATQSSYLKNLFTALIKEMVYRDLGISGKVERQLGIENTNNFGALSRSEIQRLNQTLTSTMRSYAGPLLENLCSGNFYSDVDSLSGIQRVTLDSCSYPWLRSFEMDCTVSVSYSETAHAMPQYSVPYINGISDTSFAPDRPLTRAEAAKLMIAASGTPLSDPSGCPFPDSTGSWAAPYITTCYEWGYMSGGGDGAFYPANRISRAEFAQILGNYIRKQQIPVDDSTDIFFEDVPEDSWYAEAVSLLVHSGVIRGSGSSYFYPMNDITRAEAVTMLNRLFLDCPYQTESFYDLPYILQMPRFSDVSTYSWYYLDIQLASVSYRIR